MTTKSDDLEVAQAEGLLRSARDAVGDLRREIEEIVARTQDEGTVDPADAKAAVNRLREAVIQCIKTETFLNECRSKQSGARAGSYALDLERARAEIGCKLGRLRQCSGPRAVPK